ncbi:MAG: hypothetical protein R2860_14280 [Desulfobacterales bacterium]
MYTNGILATRDKLKAWPMPELMKSVRHQRASLSHRQGRMAVVGIIPTVTVEIPAIPEDLPPLKEVVKILCDSGSIF